MAERKVLNKYYPPDFDPAKIRRFEKKTARKISNVRMMLPMSVRCYTCGNYMYLGTKFNMKVEAVTEDDYLGIKVHRFYFKCTRCYGQISFKTDPKNHDYVSEWGASKNHQPWKDMLMAEEEYKEMKKNEMKEDAMKSLEYRTEASRREMDILDAVDQVKNLNRREGVLNHEELAGKAIKDDTQDFEKEVEKLYENRKKNIRIDDFAKLSGNNEDVAQNFDMNEKFTKEYEDEECEEKTEPDLFSSFGKHHLTKLKIKKKEDVKANKVPQIINTGFKLPAPIKKK